jgi:hypothetical protein
MEVAPFLICVHLRSSVAKFLFLFCRNFETMSEMSFLAELPIAETHKASAVARNPLKPAEKSRHSLRAKVF